MSPTSMPTGARLPPSVPWADVVITCLATWGATYVLIACRWIPGWQTAFMTLSVIASGAPLLRWLAHRFPSHRVWDWAATFWIIPATVYGHQTLSLIADAVHPVLWDARLALADRRLFGAAPAVALSVHSPGWINDALMLCYYSYFLWPLGLGFFVFLFRDRKACDDFAFALAALYGANFLAYLLVPAVGPRFFLASSFPGPLPGVLTPWLESAMRMPPFMRDCFPSGHTATTLMVLVFAYRSSRTFFWVMLPFALGLITATLVGRFHYGVDVLCAVPFVLAILSLVTTASRVDPQTALIRLGRWVGWEPARAFGR